MKATTKADSIRLCNQIYLELEKQRREVGEIQMINYGSVSYTIYFSASTIVKVIEYEGALAAEIAKMR